MLQHSSLQCCGIWLGAQQSTAGWFPPQLLQICVCRHHRKWHSCLFQALHTSPDGHIRGACRWLTKAWGWLMVCFNDSNRTIASRARRQLEPSCSGSLSTQSSVLCVAARHRSQRGACLRGPLKQMWCRVPLTLDHAVTLVAAACLLKTVS